MLGHTRDFGVLALAKGLLGVIRGADPSSSSGRLAAGVSVSTDAGAGLGLGNGVTSESAATSSLGDHGGEDAVSVPELPGSECGWEVPRSACSRLYWP